jgi:hypothetical protein
MTAGSAAAEFDAATLAAWSAALAPLSPRAAWVRHLDLVHLDIAVLCKATPPADPLLARAFAADPADLGPLGAVAAQLLARSGVVRHAGGWARRHRERFTFAGGRVIPWERAPGEPTPPAVAVGADDVAAYLAGERWPRHADIVEVERPLAGASPAEAWRRTAVVRGESVIVVMADVAGGWRGFAAGASLEPALSVDDVGRAFAGFPAGWRQF